MEGKKRGRRKAVEKKRKKGKDESAGCTVVRREDDGNLKSKDR
jgi:hypothetical protein